MRNIRVGIAGGRGYVAGELLRLLRLHPNVSVEWVQSSSAPGQAVGASHWDLLHTEDNFVETPDSEVDLVFLCQGHGKSRAWLDAHPQGEHVRVIDLGNDFRLDAHARHGGYTFTYGLVESNRAAIRRSRAVANPGCFATAIQLALLPMSAGGLLRNDVHVHAITGATGAGGSLRETSHFAYRQNNLSIYKPFAHQHLGEIRETLADRGKFALPALHFLPLRGDFTRGIFASVYTETDASETDLFDRYQSYYHDHAFVHVTRETVHLKQVVNTNYCFLQIQKIDDKLLVTSIIDNLLLGAAGRAVQNMNLLFDLGERTGLGLKGSAF